MSTLINVSRNSVSEIFALNNEQVEKVAKRVSTIFEMAESGNPLGEYVASAKADFSENEFHIFMFALGGGCAQLKKQNDSLRLLASLLKS